MKFAIKRLTSKKRCGKIIVDKDKQAIYMKIPTIDYIKDVSIMSTHYRVSNLIHAKDNSRGKNKTGKNEKTVTIGQYRASCDMVSGI